MYKHRLNGILKEGMPSKRNDRAKTMDDVDVCAGYRRAYMRRDNPRTQWACGSIFHAEMGTAKR